LAFIKSKFLISPTLVACVVIAGVIADQCSHPTNPTLQIKNPAELLVADNEIPGWVLSADQLSVDGVAYNNDDLYRLRDGPGEDFVQNGFVNGAFGQYIDTNRSPGSPVNLSLEIYNQSTHSNALKVLHIFDAPGEQYEFFKNLGDVARGDTTVATHFLEMVHKTCYVRLNIYDRGAATDSLDRQILIDFGVAIVKRIDTALKP
jgi:hypothetical protein